MSDDRNSILMEKWTERIPEGFFRNDEEKWILHLTEEDLKLRAEDMLKIANNLCEKEISLRDLIGLKTRLRRAIGEELVPLNKYKSTTCVELREKRAQKKVKYSPLPFKKFDIKNSTERKREYIFNYWTIRQMYKNYLAKQDTLERYKEAREWFHEKYGE